MAVTAVRPRAGTEPAAPHACHSREARTAPRSKTLPLGVARVHHPQDAVSDVVLCTPPLPSVENIHQTVDGRWRQFAGAPPTALRATSTIRRTMVLHGCDIYSGALTTGRTGPRRHTAPSPGDEDEKFTSAHVQVRRVATPSKHPAGGRNPKVVEDDCSGCHLSPIPRCKEREPRGGAKGMQSHIRQEVPALAFFA